MKKWSKKLVLDAQNDGKPEFGYNPTNLGGYNSSPQSAEFWTTTWKTDYGQWFIQWYSKQLLNHAMSVLSQAREIFRREFLSSKLRAFIGGILMILIVPKQLLDWIIFFFMMDIVTF